jgi:cystathionine beta-lyase
MADHYNFDEIIDRRSSDSIKWATGLVFGSDEATPMWVADMDFRVPEPVIEAMVRRARHGIFGYVTRPESFYQAITGWWSRRHGWAVEKPWIVTTTRVVPGLGLSILAFTNPGDRVIVQPPVYMPFLDTVANNGRQLAFNPLKTDGYRYSMDFEDLERLARDSRTRMLILCSPHNPVGRVWTRDELLRLGDICLKNNVLIVSDEIHCDLVFSGHQHLPIASLSPELAHNTVTLTAPTKTFNIAGLDAAYAIIPDPLLHDRFCSQVEALHLSGSNVFGMLGLETAYNQGEEWLDQLLQYLECNLDEVEQYFAQHIPRIKAYRPEGTYLVWLDCSSLGLAPDELKKFMVQQAKLGLNDGAPFGPGGAGFMRMNVACPRATLLQALEQLEAAVDRL